ncbi:monocopper oxidase-like protein SKU5 isoform X1 [Vigna unguiculata]|uniref:monocopper oxidase-like protein SKU5 isoform X1 n=2 Tax=Vigna unguiculata TaxID=3917 RepID=UPI001016AAEC|nr:monocopper oxidase-like protein SKU5 isoform X1 [Vigna unguiculata]
MASGFVAPQLKLAICAILVLPFLVTTATAADIFLDWHVSTDFNLKPVSSDQPVITINGMFPGPLINTTTNDYIHVNVFNGLDDPLLFTWNGIHQRLDSWQDGVSGTNCPIPPGWNWTYDFQVKDQIGTFSYFPSINFLKAGGGYGPIRVNNRPVISVPFPKPEAEFDLLIGDWYSTSYKDIRYRLSAAEALPPDWMLINGKGPYMNNFSVSYESINVTQGKTYLLRISNVGTTWSFNFRIQNHQMVLVETEGSYVNQIELESLDVHVGQSYSVLVTANQDAADYYIVASPKMSNATDNSTLVGVAVLHYHNSTTPAKGSLPSGPDPFDLQFSINQAKSIRWNLTTGAARPNPQGTFNVSNVTISETFILNASIATIDGLSRYTVNNVSYLTPDTPLKLADYFSNGTGVYELDAFSKNSSNAKAVRGVFVASALHKGWTEIVLKSSLDMIDTWHLDGYSFFVVGMGEREWIPESRSTYNLYDPVDRSSVQVYPGGWSAVYVYPDNPGMWNLRSQNLQSWYLGEELYVRVYDADPNPAKEKPPPPNRLLCGKYEPPAPTPAPSVSPTPSAPSSNACNLHKTRYLIAMITAVICFFYIGLH